MPDPSKVLANFKPEGGQRVIAARIRGVLKSACTVPPEWANDQNRPDNFPDYKSQTDGPARIGDVMEVPVEFAKSRLTVHRGLLSHAQGMGESILGWLCFRCNHLAASDLVVGAQAKPGDKRGRTSES